MSAASTQVERFLFQSSYHASWSPQLKLIAHPSPRSVLRKPSALLWLSPSSVVPAPTHDAPASRHGLSSPGAAPLPSSDPSLFVELARGKSASVRAGGSTVESRGIPKSVAASLT